MKKIYLIIFLIFLSLIPQNINALTENEARKAITDYAYYVYNNKKGEITYVSPKEVQQERIFLGYTTSNNKYAMDCNAFAGFIVYNAFQIKANSKGGIDQPAKGDGLLTSSGRPALNGNDGWSTHSSLYNSKSYPLKAGETVQSAVSRIDLQSKLKPGDLIGIVGFGASSYSSQEESNKSTHIMVYVGDGKYIHNRSSGVSLDSITSISYGNRVGSKFPDVKGNMGPHGAITVLTLVNYESLSSDILEGYRFPDGNGKLVITKKQSGEKPSNDDPSSSSSTPGHWEHVAERLHFCEREDTAKIVRLFFLLIEIVRVAVPIMLIISLMLTITRAVINANEFDKIKKEVVVKVVASILIFLVPTFVSLITNIAGFEVSFAECREMAKSPKKVNVWVDGEEETTTVEDEELKVEQKGIYIVLSSKNVTGYYFSNKKETLTIDSNLWIASNKDKIDFILLPGTHYMYVKTSNGKIFEKSVNIKSSDIIVTNDVKDIKLLTTSLDAFLKEKGSSIDEFNDAIARSVYIAGGQTKAGASAASLALTQILYIKYKVKIPYGSSRGNHVAIGVPPVWGSPEVTSLEKKGNFLNQGIHCGGFVAWSYAQANFDMNSGIGSSSTLCRWRYASIKGIGSNDKGEVGDALTYATACEQSSHVSIINAIDNQGYYLTESNAVTRTIDDVKTLLNNIGIVTTYDKFGDRWHSYLNMDLTVGYRKKNTPLEKGF